jgi:hypothetical protein
MGFPDRIERTVERAAPAERDLELHEALFPTHPEVSPRRCRAGEHASSPGSLASGLIKVERGACS